MWLRILTIFTLSLLACRTSPPPDNPAWIDVSSDRGPSFFRGRIVTPPTMPMSVCLDRNSPVLLQHVTEAASALATWHGLLKEHLSCAPFVPVAPRDSCTVILRDVSREEANQYYVGSLAIALVHHTPKGQVSQCEVLLPTDLWRYRDPTSVIVHEVGHCLGLADDPFVGDTPSSIMQAYNVPPSGLTRMDARLIIRNHTCLER